MTPPPVKQEQALADTVTGTAEAACKDRQPAAGTQGVTVALQDSIPLRPMRRKQLCVCTPDAVMHWKSRVAATKELATLHAHQLSPCLCQHCQHMQASQFANTHLCFWSRRCCHAKPCQLVHQRQTTHKPIHATAACCRRRRCWADCT